jgi:hypothetical protein
MSEFVDQMRGGKICKLYRTAAQALLAACRASTSHRLPWWYLTTQSGVSLLAVCLIMVTARGPSWDFFSNFMLFAPTGCVADGVHMLVYTLTTRCSTHSSSTMHSKDNESPSY